MNLKGFGNEIQTGKYQSKMSYQMFYYYDVVLITKLKRLNNLRTM